MAALTIPYDNFVAGTTIVSQQVDDNNSAIVDYINARNSGVTPWDSISTAGSLISTATSNQLVLGTTRTVTITAPTPASSSRTHTIPDVSGDSSFIMAAGAQTITGAKTFTSSTLLLQEASSTDVVTVAVASLAASRIYTVPDAGGAAEFVMNAGTQSIAGAKTFTTQLIGAGTATNDNAAAGYIGEAARAVQSAATNTGANLVWGDLVSISLTAGDWDVSAMAQFSRNTATWTEVSMGISSTSGNSASGLTDGDNILSNTFSSSATTPVTVPMTIPAFRVSLSGTTTYYLKYRAEFSGGQPQARGRISARRVR